MNETQVKNLIAIAIRDERTRAANQMSAFIEKRHKELFKGRTLDSFIDTPITYWDMKMLANEMRFKPLPGESDG